MQFSIILGFIYLWIDPMHGALAGISRHKAGISRHNLSNAFVSEWAQIPQHLVKNLLWRIEGFFNKHIQYDCDGHAGSHGCQVLINFREVHEVCVCVGVYLHAFKMPLNLKLYTRIFQAFITSKGEMEIAFKDSIGCSSTCQPCDRLATCPGCCLKSAGTGFSLPTTLKE